MSKIFARPLTKDYLQKHGVKEIMKDCKVIFEDGRVLEKEEDFSKDKGYLQFNVFELDENGNRIKISVKRRIKGYEKLYSTHIYKVRTIYLHRAMWAWFNGEVPKGLVIDHITNKHDTLYDNRLENLQLLSPEDHARKDRTLSNRELKCKMTLPLSYYEDKLNTFINKYNNSKDQKDKRLLVAYICQYKARIRYWKSHEEEYKKNEEAKAIKANALKTQKEEAKNKSIQYHKIVKEKKHLKSLVDEARKIYKDNPTIDNKYNWRLAIKVYNDFIEKN